jgi:hypothetical protein
MKTLTNYENKVFQFYPPNHTTNLETIVKPIKETYSVPSHSTNLCSSCQSVKEAKTRQKIITSPITVNLFAMTMALRNYEKNVFQCYPPPQIQKQLLNL